MTASEVITKATERLNEMVGHRFSQLIVNKPTSSFEALNMAKITSKISPLVGNLFEIDTVEKLTGDPELGNLGTWIRQDLGFPDVLLNLEDDTEARF